MDAIEIAPTFAKSTFVDYPADEGRLRNRCGDFSRPLNFLWMILQINKMGMKIFCAQFGKLRYSDSHHNTERCNTANTATAGAVTTTAAAMRSGQLVRSISWSCSIPTGRV